MMRTTIRAAYAMLAGAVVVAATAEAGNPMPRYDVAAYCGKVSEAVGESPDLRLLLPEGKRGLRRSESSLGHGAGEGPAHCDDIGRAGGSYQTLDYCVRKELDTAGGPPVLKF